MPNKRAPGQKLLSFPVDEKFAQELDSGLARAGCRNRSQFIRDAIIEKLERANIHLSKDLALPPPRLGKKSGLKKILYPPHRPSALALNENADLSKKSARKNRQ